MATNIIPSDQASYFSSLTPVQQTVYAYPSPLPYGIAGLTFDIRGEERLEFKSEITDHWLENNSAIHDQISLSPEKVTLKGSIGIIAYQTPLISNAPVQSAAALPLNTPLIPTQTPGSSQAALSSTAPTANAINANTTNLYQWYLGNSNIDGANPNLRQQNIVGFLYQLWNGRVLFTVETPWGIFTNMAIESCEPSQDATTTNITDISVTFKKIRLASQVIINPDLAAGRLIFQQTEANPSLNGNIGQVTLSSQAADQIYQKWLKDSKI
jgi:hypothetical protein